MALAVAACLALTGTASAVPATLRVDDDGVQCPTAAFTDIQAAVAAAAAGDTVLVCDGIYQQQVEIGAGKDNLHLRANVVQKAIIKSPSVVNPKGAIVRVTGGVKNVEVSRFTISGPGSGTLRFGLLVDADSSAGLVRDNRFRVIRNNTLAFVPGTAVGIGDPTDGTPGKIADLSHNTIERYVVDGVRITNPGSYGMVEFNTFNGLGDQSISNNNGLKVDDGAKVKATGNDIHGHHGIGGTAGILLDGAASGSSVLNNTLFDNDFGLDVDNTVGALIQSNRSTLNDNGIRVGGTSATNTIKNNEMRTNTVSDCEDTTAGAGTGGTANTWLLNRGVITNNPAICTP